MQITTIGLDIAKNVFQVHGVDSEENVVVRKRLRRGHQVIAFFEALTPCLVGMEACATSHYWAGFADEAWPRGSADAVEGRQRLRQAQHERCGRRQGNLRSSSPANNTLCVSQVGRTARSVDAAPHARCADAAKDPNNALRAHLAELGITAAQGREGIKELLAIIADDRDQRLPTDARASLRVLAAQLQAMQTLLSSLEKRIMVQHRANADSRRLETIPGIGIVGATAIAATVTDPKVFPVRAWCICGLD